jgi:hypothetical protein
MLLYLEAFDFVYQRTEIDSSRHLRDDSIERRRRTDATIFMADWRHALDTGNTGYGISWWMARKPEATGYEAGSLDDHLTARLMHAIRFSNRLCTSDLLMKMATIYPVRRTPLFSLMDLPLMAAKFHSENKDLTPIDLSEWLSVAKSNGQRSWRSRTS